MLPCGELSVCLILSRIVKISIREMQFLRGCVKSGLSCGHLAGICGRRSDDVRQPRRMSA